MGLNDRDYMRRSPDRELVDDYERRSVESEYGSGDRKRRSRAKALLAAIMVIGAIMLLVALRAGR